MRSSSSGLADMPCIEPVGGVVRVRSVIMLMAWDNRDLARAAS